MPNAGHAHQEPAHGTELHQRAYCFVEGDSYNKKSEPTAVPKHQRLLEDGERRIEEGRTTRGRVEIKGARRILKETERLKPKKPYLLGIGGANV